MARSASDATSAPLPVQRADGWFWNSVCQARYVDEFIEPVFDQLAPFAGADLGQLSIIRERENMKTRVTIEQDGQWSASASNSAIGQATISTASAVKGELRARIPLTWNLAERLRSAESFRPQNPFDEFEAASFDVDAALELGLEPTHESMSIGARMGAFAASLMSTNVALPALGIDPEAAMDTSAEKANDSQVFVPSSVERNLCFSGALCFPLWWPGSVADNGASAGDAAKPMDNSSNRNRPDQTVGSAHVDPAAMLFLGGQHRLLLGDSVVGASLVVPQYLLRLVAVQTVARKTMDDVDALRREHRDLGSSMLQASLRHSMHVDGAVRSWKELGTLIGGSIGLAPNNMVRVSAATMMQGDSPTSYEGAVHVNLSSFLSTPTFVKAGYSSEGRIGVGFDVTLFDQVRVSLGVHSSPDEDHEMRYGLEIKC